MNRKSPTTKMGRRALFTGMFGGIGIATAALAARKTSAAGGKEAASQKSGPVLYQRTKETERYFKTLDF